MSGEGGSGSCSDSLLVSSPRAGAEVDASTASGSAKTQGSEHQESYRYLQVDVAHMAGTCSNCTRGGFVSSHNMAEGQTWPVQTRSENEEALLFHSCS